MSAAGTSNPEYVNTRVRSRRSELFDEEDYRKLVRMGPSEIARYMEESTYEDSINALGARYSGVDLIEYALNRDLAKQFHDILDWADGRLYELIARYLRRFDAWNVKTIIRGIYADADREGIETDLIPAGEFSDRRLDRLLEATTLEEVVEMLSDTPFGEPLTDAYEVYEETDLLVPLENAIDRTFYENLLSDISARGEGEALYVEVLRAEVDFRNARNAFRIARSGADIDPGEYFIEGGVLFTEAELSALAGNVDELTATIRESRYGNQLSDALSRLEEADSLVAFEHAMEAALLEYADTIGNTFPLSITPIVSYLLAKEREVDNIRAIARGREAGLSRQQIEEELLIL